MIIPVRSGSIVQGRQTFNFPLFLPPPPPPPPPLPPLPALPPPLPSSVGMRAYICCVHTCVRVPMLVCACVCVCMYVCACVRVCLNVGM